MPPPGRARAPNWPTGENKREKQIETATNPRKGGKAPAAKRDATDESPGGRDRREMDVKAEPEAAAPRPDAAVPRRQLSVDLIRTFMKINSVRASFPVLSVSRSPSFIAVHEDGSAEYSRPMYICAVPTTRY